MTVNRDDEMIGGMEFRARRGALGLTQPVIQQHLGVKRSALDRWTRGTARIPRRVREMLEMAESDVDATIDYLVDQGDAVLTSEPAEGWPWGQETWLVVIARARQGLSENGVKAIIV